MNKLLIINVCSNYGSTGKIAEQCGMLMKQKGREVYCDPDIIHLLKIRGLYINFRILFEYLK